MWYFSFEMKGLHYTHMYTRYEYMYMYIGGCQLAKYGNEYGFTFTFIFLN